MADKLLRSIIIKGQKRPAGRQSDAYRWLFKRHRPMALAFETNPPTWSDIAGDMKAAGITGGRKKPLTDRAVRRIWERICRDIAAAQARPKTPAARTLMPSASPKERVPIEYPRPQPLPPKPAEPSGPASPTDGTPGQSRADATIARMKRHFAERDGRKPTP